MAAKWCLGVLLGIAGCGQSTGFVVSNGGISRFGALAASRAAPAPLVVVRAKGRTKDEDRKLIAEDEALRWYTLQVAAGSERSVAVKIELMAKEYGLWQEDIGEVVAPMAKLLTSRGEKISTEEQAIYPGCIFIQMRMNMELHSMITGINRVVTFVGADVAERRRQRHHVLPQPMPDAEMDAVLKMVEKESQDPSERVGDIEIGSMVRILRGAKGGEEGAVRSLRRGWLIVRCWGYGQHIDVQTRLEDVRKLTEKEVRAYMANDPISLKPTTGINARSGRAGAVTEEMREELEAAQKREFVPPSQRPASDTARTPTDGESFAPGAESSDPFDVDSFLKELDDMQVDEAGGDEAAAGDVYGEADVSTSASSFKGAPAAAAAGEDGGDEADFFSELMSQLEKEADLATAVTNPSPAPTGPRNRGGRGAGPPLGRPGRASPKDDLESLNALFDDDDFFNGDFLSGGTFDEADAPTSGPSSGGAPRDAPRKAAAAPEVVEGSGDDDFFDSLMRELSQPDVESTGPGAVDAAEKPRARTAAAADVPPETEEGWDSLFDFLDTTENLGSKGELPPLEEKAPVAQMADDESEPDLVGALDALDLRGEANAPGTVEDPVAADALEEVGAPAADTAWIDKLKVAELKEECKKRGLKVGGTKAVLQERLREALLTG